MAFARKESVVPAVDLATLSPVEVERRIIDGVRKYATRQDNWASADKNTPFLGTIQGMGIESANLVDITLSMERQFLTRKTRRVPANPEGTEFRLADGELGKVVIAEGEDAFAATPGLAVRMLMDAGHLARDEAYLADVVSFAYVVVIGEGHRLGGAIRKATAKVDRAAEAREAARENLRALVEQGRIYLNKTADATVLAASQREEFARQKAAADALGTEIGALSEQMRETTDPARLEGLKTRQSALRLRLSRGNLMYRIAEVVARDTGHRSAVEEAKVQEMRRSLAATLSDAQATAGLV